MPRVLTPSSLRTSPPTNPTPPSTGRSPDTTGQQGQRRSWPSGPDRCRIRRRQPRSGPSYRLESGPGELPTGPPVGPLSPPSFTASKATLALKARLCLLLIFGLSPLFLTVVTGLSDLTPKLVSPSRRVQPKNFRRSCRRCANRRGMHPDRAPASGVRPLPLVVSWLAPCIVVRNKATPGPEPRSCWDVAPKMATGAATSSPPNQSRVICLDPSRWVFSRLLLQAPGCFMKRNQPYRRLFRMV